MLTRNFMHMLSVDMCVGSNLDTSAGMPASLKNIEGNEITAYLPALGNNGNAAVFSSSNFSKAKLVIGTEDTAEKTTDYCLESKITEGYDCSLLSKRYIKTDKKDSIYIYGVITNTGDSAITVTEVGLEMWDGYSSTGYFLMARQVLDKPVTIEPGEAKTFNVLI